MANIHRGEVDIVLGGQHYTMRPTFEALVEFEDRAGIDALSAIGKMVHGQGFSARAVAAAIYAGIKAGWPPASTRRMPTYSEVGAMVQAEGLPKMAMAFGTFLTKALSSDEDLKRAEEEAAKGKQPAPETSTSLPAAG